ncbi:tripartite tricarboxylate transporter substrate binding protein [Roseococcus sp. SYP-B2431]|uniref:Bug family tripartite tricarboxylate transporter substrate binding protein n=1 Tax=Roseococcus sp. SYP-B2431 TaxID=2496640 RepID=UPI00103ECA11|nr:tripartite tricarboxylate transporter substrate binding protein [Roseococcus sp. SYP-B2431]TCH98330.1 tripartite tricarboxylate transporter substrate binding protein [Roseococcus sp. SYP-B2431]
MAHALGRRGALAVGLGALASPALAQAFPNKPIRIVCASPPGSFTDLVDRVFADQLASLGQPVIVDNKPGANGVIAAAEIARSAPDGHTLGHLISASLTLAPVMVPRLPYTLDDLQPITTIYRGAMAIAVSSRLGIENMNDLVAYVRQRGSLSYGSIGRASPAHILMEMLSAETNLTLENVVYRGEAPAVLDVLAGTIPVAVGGPMNFMEQQRAGAIRIIGVSTAERLPGLPDIPTFREQGFQSMVYTWFHGFVVRAGTPRPIVDRLHGAIGEVMRTQPFLSLLSPDLVPDLISPEAYSALIREDQGRLRTLIEQRGITAG